MAENKFPQIAEMLGVKLEEVFHIQGGVFPYKFTSKGLCYQNTIGEWIHSEGIFPKILRGECEIIMPPYRPNRGDRYFSYADFSWDIRCFGWDNLPLDYARLEAGMVFRTQDEACKELPSVYKKVTGKDW